MSEIKPGQRWREKRRPRRLIEVSADRDSVLWAGQVWAVTVEHRQASAVGTRTCMSEETLRARWREELAS